jgi:surface antigen
MLIKSALASETVQKLDKTLHRKSTRKRIVRYGLIGFNAMLLFGVLAFVFLGQRTQGVGSAHSALASTVSADSVANPLDQVSSADIAYNVAAMSALPEAVAVGNQAASVNLELNVAPATASIVSKPQIVKTTLPSKKDIKSYVVHAGETVASIAAKFNVTSDSIRWSNNLSSNTVVAGQTLWLPPEGVSGIVYTVKAGDTPDTLAAKYHASKDEIISYNDAEITSLKPGERIIIPNGKIIAAPSYSGGYSAGLAYGSSPIYGGNAYDYGYCTWYVANRIAVPSNWGNANTWDNGAVMSGWTVSSIPRPGAIAQTDRGSEGHVAVVEAVSADGTQIKYSDMNGLAGWGRVGYSDWTSSSRFEHYIYH